MYFSNDQSKGTKYNLLMPPMYLEDFSLLLLSVFPLDSLAALYKFKLGF